MEPSPSDLARAIERLERRVSAIEGALATAGAGLQSVPSFAGGPTDPAAPAADADVVAFMRQGFASVPALVGRTFLALAGAYLLRALTDAGTLPPPLGVAAGLAYAALWLVLADRAARSAPTSATYHALVAALVAFPLVWEATARFALFGAATSAVVLAIVTAAGLGVAAYRRLHVVGWIVAVPAAAAAAALVPATDRIVPFAVFLVALGVTTLWLGYVRDWLVLRWPIALAANLAVIGVTVRVAMAHGVETAAGALGVQVLLIGAYLVSIIVRTLVRGRDVIPFEVVQGIVALAVGLGGAVVIARGAPSGTEAVGFVTAVLGAGCYVTAFVFIADRQGERSNFYFYTTLAVMLVLASAHLLLAEAALAVALGALTVAAALTAAATGPRFLVVHAVIYAIAAALTSGLLVASTYRLVAPVAIAWPALTAAMAATLAAAAVSEIVPLPKRGGPWDVWAHPARLVLLLIAAWGAAGYAIDWIATPWLPPSAADPGILATVRSGVLATAALLLAAIGRHELYREARWIVYPLLFLGGVKLLMEDLPRSRPSTLFVAFALYGTAMIFAPRLGHHKGREGHEATESNEERGAHETAGV